MAAGSRIARAALALLALSTVFAEALPAQALPAKALAPIPAATLALMREKGSDARAPVVFRAYKRESEIEVWKRTTEGRYAYVRTYPICRWSGQLGPKRRNGDRQVPEGFYTVGARQMNPNSRYYLSFDVGFPNAYDRAHGATGSAIMVHGTCSSMGCFAMTDKAVGEIYAIAREALAGGQSAIPFQAFPFRMTAANMARHRTDPEIAFWRELKEGSDRFEALGEPAIVSVAAGHYAFAAHPDPEREAQAQARLREEALRTATLIAAGAGAVRTTYADGGQHPSFVALAARGAHLGEVSRPEALAFAGQEVVTIPARRRPAEPAKATTAEVMQAALIPRPVLDAPAVDLTPPEREPPLFLGESVAASPTRLTLFSVAGARPAFLDAPRLVVAAGS